MTVSLVLSNAEFPPLSTVSKLNLTSINLSLINIFLIQRLRHLFRRLFFLYLETLFLRINLFSNCYVTHQVRMNLFQFKVTLLRSHVNVVKTLFRTLRVSFLKVPTIFTVNTVLPPNVCIVISRINLTHRLCKAPLYTHTAVVNSPTNTFTS